MRSPRPSGENSLNLTFLRQVQGTLSVQNKISKVTIEQKREAVVIENKTTEQAERQLDAVFPNLFVQLTEQEAKELERSRELLSHALSNATHGTVTAKTYAAANGTINTRQRSK